MPERFDVLAVREAIQTLGYLRPQAECTMRSLLQDAFCEHPRAVCARYRGRGEQLDRDEKRALGIRANAYMSRAAFMELTDRGKTIPLKAHELTLLRIEFTRIRKRNVEKAADPGIDPRLRACMSFKHTMLSNHCPGCARISAWGSIPADRVQIMPPIDCSVDACNLGVDVKIDCLSYGIS